MGLLTIIRKNKRKEREMRILFLGLDNAGKTTILKRLKGQDVMSTSPTLGFEISTLTHGKYLLNIWDVGGQRTLRPYWRNYFEQTDVLVWVVDSGDRLRMNDCREELHALLQEQRLAGASLLVFANKQDITGSMTDAEIKRTLDLPSIRSHRWRIQACSAFTGENVHSGLEWAVSEVAQRVYWGVVDVDTSAGVNTSVIPENQPSSAVGDHNGVFVVRGSGVIRAALKFGTRVFLTQCHSMTAVDVSIYPNATGNALDTVRNHSAGDVDTSELVFYSGWFCPFVQRAWIALEEKGIPYLYQEENPYKKDAKFIEKFPKGLVPGALYKGKPIAESLVILEFLEDAYPQVPLLPSDPYARAQVRYAVDNVTKSILPPFYRLLQAQEVEKQDEARQDLYEGLRTFAKGTSGPFWAGEQFTHADITLLPFIVRLPILETHRGFKKAEVGHDFEAYTERVVALPSVQRTLSEPDRYEEVYGRYLRNESQSEVAKNTRARRILP